LLKDSITRKEGITIVFRTHSTVGAIKLTYNKMSEANEQLKYIYAVMAENAKKDPRSVSSKLMEAIQDDIAEFEEITNLYNSINLQKIEKVTNKLNTVKHVKIDSRVLNDAQSNNQNMLSKANQNDPYMRAAKSHMTVFRNIRSKN